MFQQPKKRVIRQRFVNPILLSALGLKILTVGQCAHAKSIAESENGPAAWQSEAQRKILRRDLRRLLQWLPGRYDNAEQHYFMRSLDFPAGYQLARTHYIVSALDTQAFGGKAFYVEQYHNDDPGNIVQQTVYGLTLDDGLGAIRMQRYFPKSSAATGLDFSQSDITAQFETTSNCDIIWQFRNSHYRGHLESPSCVNVWTDENRAIEVATDFQLSENSFWVGRGMADISRNAIGGRDSWRGYEQNNRARTFNCFVAPRKKDGSYAFYNNLRVHDQGGWIRIAATDEHEEVAIRLRRVVWPMGVNRPATVVYGHRGGNEAKADQYSWTSYDEKRIGINFRWMQASCTQGETVITPSLDLKTGAGS